MAQRPNDGVDAQLVAKEQHRQKRRRQRLNKATRRRLRHSKQQSTDRPNKRHKTKRSEWSSLCVVDLDDKSIRIDESDVDDDDDFDDEGTLYTDRVSTEISYESTVHRIGSTSSGSDSVRGQTEDSRTDSEDVRSEESEDIDVRPENDDDAEDNEHSDVLFGDDGARGRGLSVLDMESDTVSWTDGDTEVDDDDDQRADISLSAYFEAAECCSARQRSVKLEFSSKSMEHLCGLYTPSSRKAIVGMLRSARCGRFEHGQVTVIGTAANELVDVLEGVVVDCPMDIIYAITDFVGNALVWLRAPGMNAVKWSAAPKAVERRQRAVHCAVDEGDALFSSAHSPKGPNGRWTSQHRGAAEEEDQSESESVGVTSSLSAFGGHFGFSDDTFYFSGYGLDEMDEAMVYSVDDQNPLIFVDLDWILAAFLTLGVVPEDTEEDAPWLRYLNHKLLSALPGNCSLCRLMAS